MTRALSLHRLSLATLCAVAALSAFVSLHSVGAQEQRTIQVEAGQTLEIGTDTLFAKPDVSWILTKDRKFQSAQRARFFQTRLAEPGTYVLDVSVKDAVTGGSEYRSFTIIVTEPTGNAPLASGDRNQPLSPVLRTEPPAIGTTAYVQPSGGVLQINPGASNGAIATYTIDLDTSVDSDTDGNPANDHDTLGTLSEKSGTPLFVFLIPKSTERRIALTVADLAGSQPQTTELAILFAQSPVPVSSSEASSQETLQSGILMTRDSGKVQFSAALDTATTEGKQLLYEWDFGDRSRSLLDTPLHTYTTAGTFTVNLRIRDITTAEIVHEGSAMVTIDMQPVTSSASSSVSGSSGTTPQKSSVSLTAILYVGFILIVLLTFAVGLYFLSVWIKRKTTNSLQKTLEKMEGSIVKKDPVPEAKAAPMKLKKDAPQPAKQEQSLSAETVIDREKAKREFATEQRTNESPTAQAGPVPSWLAKSTTVPPPSVPKPVPPPAAEEKAPVPAWLKQTPAPTPAVIPPTPPTPTPPPAPSAPTPPPAPAPKPAPLPEPKPAPAMPPPAPVPAPKPAPAPTMPSVPKPVPPPTPVVPPSVPPTPKSPVLPPEVKTAEAPKTAPVALPPLPTPKPPVAPPEPPKPAPVSQPILPAEPVAKDIPKQSDDDDRTIAIIQADSLTK